MQLLCVFLLITSILQPSQCQYATLQIQYSDSAETLYVKQGTKSMPMSYDGKYYRHCFLKEGDYEIHSDDASLTTIHINAHHLQEGMKLSLKKPKKHEVKQSIPYALFFFAGLGFVFFGWLGYMWMKLFPKSEIE